MYSPNLRVVTGISLCTWPLITMAIYYYTYGMGIPHYEQDKTACSVNSATDVMDEAGSVGNGTFQAVYTTSTVYENVNSESKNTTKRGSSSSLSKRTSVSKTVLKKEGKNSNERESRVLIGFVSFGLWLVYACLDTCCSHFLTIIADVEPSILGMNLNCLYAEPGSPRCKARLLTTTPTTQYTVCGMIARIFIQYSLPLH